MSTEATRILDLDDDGSIEVRLGGQTFWIRQQRRALVQKVIQAIHQNESAPLPEDIEGGKYLDFACQSLADTYPAFALILGVEDTDSNYGETLAHLETHLNFPKAQKIFERWWDINKIEDFLFVGGNPLVLTTEIAARRERLAAFRAANGAATPDETASPAIPISN